MQIIHLWKFKLEEGRTSIKIIALYKFWRLACYIDRNSSGKQHNSPYQLSRNPIISRSKMISKQIIGFQTGGRVNWGYSHPIRRCLYGTLTRTNDPWLASSPNKHNCITDHKILPKSIIRINMLTTPIAAYNSYDLLSKSSLLPSSLPTTLLYITWLSAHILTHSSESLLPEIN